MLVRYSIDRISACFRPPYCRYSNGRISPSTASPPIPDGKPSSSCRTAADTASQHLPVCQHLPACESFNKRLLPATHTPPGHTTRAGKDSHSIMIVIIIMISIRLIYIFILFLFCWTLKTLQERQSVYCV